jgi:hypothetical protein
MADLTLVEKRASGWFWRVPAVLDCVQPPLTDDAVRAAEAQLGVKLPDAYVELLRQQNGGYLRASWPASYAQMLRGIGPTSPSLTLDQTEWRLANRAASGWAPTKPALLIPFDGENHWAMCFDYRKHGPLAEPRITYVDAECEEEEPVAKSFLAYLAGLVDRHAESTRIYGGTTAESVARALAQQLGAPAPRWDDFACGHGAWRIALRGDHQWCWVSANRVPASIRREGAASRGGASEETALQIPEDPACALLISATHDARKAVSEGLTALGLL